MSRLLPAQGGHLAIASVACAVVVFACHDGDTADLVSRDAGSGAGGSGAASGSFMGGSGGIAADADGGGDVEAEADAASSGGLPCFTDADCDDHDLCTGKESCVQGTCHAGVKLSCNDQNPCTRDLCEPDTGACSFDLVADGAPCLDGDLCDGQVCLGGACMPGTPVVCADDGNPCGTQACDPALGACISTIAADGASCADGNLCNGDEVCSSGVCRSGSVRNCDDNNPCTTDSCDPTQGCLHVPLANGTTCSDGNLCNGVEVCTAGQCVSGPDANCDDGNVCTTDTCKPATGACVFTPIPNGTACPDGNLCDGQVCQAGSCVAGSPVVCPDDGDNNPCTASTCQPASGSCAPHALDAVACPDGNLCDGQQCVQGICTAGTGPVNCDDGQSCTTDGCTPATGVCTHAPVADNSDCPDSDRCDGGKCQAGVCQPGAPKNCDDGQSCTTDGCTSATGVCTHAPLADNSDCPDGNLCDGGKCQAGVCQPGAAKDCGDGNVCTQDLCTPATGQCSNPPINGGFCPDSDLCDGQVCSAGQCVSGTPVSCTVPQTCNATTGLCQP